MLTKEQFDKIIKQMEINPIKPRVVEGEEKCYFAQSVVATLLDFTEMSKAEKENIYLDMKHINVCLSGKTT